jgi:uncharacterized membrane-anchored protein YhcB (DUF1043 family)
MNLQEIQQELEGGQVNPGTLAEYRVLLSGKYSRAAEMLSNILKDKPAKWLELREKHKSSKETDMAWEMTEEGKKENELRFTCKRIDKMTSAISSLLRVREGESRNLY